MVAIRMFVLCICNQKSYFKQPLFVLWHPQSYLINQNLIDLTIYPTLINCMFIFYIAVTNFNLIMSMSTNVANMYTFEYISKCIYSMSFQIIFYVSILWFIVILCSYFNCYLKHINLHLYYTKAYCSCSSKFLPYHTYILTHTPVIHIFWYLSVKCQCWAIEGLKWHKIIVNFKGVKETWNYN